jgi:glutamyl-tRNA synthetase
MEFARLSIDGMPVSKRLITPLIEKNLVTGYDDIRLPTLQGLRKRGIVPKALKNFVFSQGISKVESVVSFSLVESENRKVIDPLAKRLFFVPNPCKLLVSNAPNKETKLPFHPTDPSLGNRLIKTNDTFYISADDAMQLSNGDIFRLKGLYNVKLEQKNDILKGVYAGDEVKPDSLKVQWVTVDSEEMAVYKPDTLFIKNEFNKDSLSIISGRVEAAVHLLNHGDIVQFERFGFVRIEKNNHDLKGFFTHR